MRRKEFIESTPPAGHVAICADVELGASRPGQELELRRLPRGPLLRVRRRQETPQVQGQREGDVAEDLRALDVARFHVRFVANLTWHVYASDLLLPRPMRFRTKIRLQ